MSRLDKIALVSIVLLLLAVVARYLPPVMSGHQQVGPWC
jgi:hypothetical protein